MIGKYVNNRMNIFYLHVFSINCYQSPLLQVSLEVELHCRLDWNGASRNAYRNLCMDLGG